jgi:membrane protein
MPWTTSDRVIELRSKHHTIDVFVEMLDGWRRHLSGRNASLLSFFGFLSIFPLLLAATTILGFVLEGNAELQQEIADGAFAEIPVLGTQLQENPASLDGNIRVLIIGLGGALWASTKAFVGLQGALDDVWEVPVDDRAKLPVLRGKALAGIAIIGASLIASVIVAGIINKAGLPAGSVAVLLVLNLVAEIVVIAAMYRYLTSAQATWRMVWPGAIAAGIAFAVIQNFSTALVTRITENASDTYGQFALVLGIVTWLSLLSIAALMCAELNAAIERIDRRRQSESRVEIEEADSSVR